MTLKTKSCFFLFSLCYSYWNQMILLAKTVAAPIVLATSQSVRHCKWWASPFITSRLVFLTDENCIVTANNYSHCYFHIIMICYSMLIYNAISFILYFLNDMNSILYFGSQSKLLSMVQFFFWQVQKVMLVAAFH